MFTNAAENTPLTVLLVRAERAVMDHLLASLSAEFPGVTAAHLAFFGALDCGVTHASAAASRLGISRQAVSRTVRELVDLGLIDPMEATGQGGRSRITMTPKGEALALSGRACLAALEDRLGPGSAADLRSSLTALAGA